MSYNLKPSLAKGSNKCYVLATGGPFYYLDCTRAQRLNSEKIFEGMGSFLFLVHWFTLKMPELH